MTVSKSNKIIIPDKPSVGDKLYVPSSLEIPHEEDAFSGGICTIRSIHNPVSKKTSQHYWFVRIEEDGGENQWNWGELMKQQEELRKIYGKKRGYKPETE